jgi:molybdopterin biosynthesis enzyme
MKPGKPLTFAVLPRPSPDARPCLVFGLPGNPASAAVTFALTVAPCLRALAGHAAPLPRRVHAELAGGHALDPARPEYARAVLTWEPRDAADPSLGGRFVAAGTGNQISSRLASVRGANALLELPRAGGGLAPGTVVTALLVGDVRVGPAGGAFGATPAPAT